VTPLTYCVRHVRELNMAIKSAADTSLDRETLSFRVYADAFFSSNDDYSSQLGYIVVLCDGKHR